MSALMSRLRDDHVNVEKLLQVLEHQVARAAGGDSPDYDLLEDVVEYFLAYPEAYHHPLENLVYHRLAAARPDRKAELGNLETDHTRITAETHSLANLLRLILQDGAVSHQDFQSALEAFVVSQRRHMVAEEETFFPLAEEALASADWDALDIQAEQRADPVFGSTVEARFKALRDRIFSWDDDS